MGILSWKPDSEIIEFPDDEVVNKSRPWYKKSISIPLWGISTVIVVASAAASYAKFSKRR